ncbi:MAG: heme-copper oxidase subunit III [Bacteroidetes bacterium]|nr:MAG: heme-copper oxidase subunit III [Bacteroidota bacterium]
MEIPYTVHPRPDTGVTNAKVGIWLFLASEIMLFGGLFSAYIFLRMGAPEWPGTTMSGHYYASASDILSVPLAALNTVILIASSVTIVLAWASLMTNNFSKYRIYMGLTILMSFGFLIVKSIEYSTKFEHGLFPSESTFLAIYFVMTGLHAIHVIGGIVVNAYLLGPGAKMWKTNPTQYTNRIEVAGLYWHFVDIVWIFLFPTIYLI